MKKNLIYLFILLMSASCSTGLRVEKKIYSKGYYVEAKCNNKIKGRNITKTELKNNDTCIAFR